MPLYIPNKIKRVRIQIEIEEPRGTQVTTAELCPLEQVWIEHDYFHGTIKFTAEGYLIGEMRNELRPEIEGVRSDKNKNEVN